MSAKHLVATLLIQAALAAALAAQSMPPPIPVELRARFGFLGPYVVKIGDGINGLQVVDYDGDSRREVLVCDPRRARIAVLRWDGTAPVLQPVPTDGQINGFAVADVDGDHKPDLLLVDGRGRLAVRKGSGAAEAEAIDLGLGGRGVGLLTEDLDGDGSQDVVAASRTGIRWITRLSGAPVLSPIEPLEENVHGLRVADFDGDQKADLALCAPGPAMNLRLRRGHGDGTFGPWLIGNLDGLRQLIPMRLPDGKPALAAIEGPHRRVAVHKFAATGGKAAIEWWALGDSADKSGKAMPFATGDVDNDGDQDLVLAQGERARLLFFLWQDGSFVLRPVPTLAGTSSVAIGDVDQDGKQDLVLTSPEEDAVAWKRGTLPLDAFPERLPCADKPVAAAVDPQGGVLVIARNDKRDARIDRLQPGQPAVKVADLGRLPADPVRLLLADIGDQDGIEAVFVVPGEGLRIVNLGGGADKTDKTDKAAKAGGDVAGFTKKIDDGALALTEHDGRPALLVVRDRFLRVFRSDDKGQLQVLSQDNGPEGAAELSLAALQASGSRLYVDKKNGKLLRSTAAAPVTSLDLPPFEFTHLIEHGGAALLLGPRGVLRIPFGDGPSLQTLAVHEPPTDRTGYWQGKAADFDGDGIDDLAILDGHLPGVQILAGGKGTLQRALAMPVFEAPPSEEPSDEPREMAVGDVDGDGRIDLVLIAHDRVLIYLQEK